MKLTRRDIAELTFLRDRGPAWGGHLQRGQPLTDPVMRRWLDLGLIETEGTSGYVITPAGRAALNQKGEE